MDVGRVGAPGGRHGLRRGRRKVGNGGEAGQGRELAQWYVYGSPWFVGLLALLGVNILAATLIRFPWKT